MRDIQVFISNGSDTDRYRDVAADVLNRLRQLLQYELGYDVTISNWDYRNAPPGVVPAGSLAGVSLGVVDRSNALIAIFGRRCPRITRDEVRRALERKSAGEDIELFTFVNPRLKTTQHDAFFAEMRADFGVEIVWAPYANRLTFQAQVFTTGIGFLLKHLEIGNPTLLGTAT